MPGKGRLLANKIKPFTFMSGLLMVIPKNPV